MSKVSTLEKCVLARDLSEKKKKKYRKETSRTVEYFVIFLPQK